MRFTTLVVAAFASTALAVPTSLEPMTKRTTGIEPLTKRMEKCGQFTESRYLVIGSDGKPIGINGPIGTIEGNNNCQNLDNPNGDKQFYFELFGYCEWCKLVITLYQLYVRHY
jgi:hypothetical protein